MPSRGLFALPWDFRFTSVSNFLKPWTLSNFLIFSGRESCYLVDILHVLPLKIYLTDMMYPSVTSQSKYILCQLMK